uniref:Uncharacterized protein n=1 Tax=Arundo donax TaxID=35708 RepID=A0A0A9FA03_ARUDO
MSVMGTLVNSSGYHVTGSLPLGLWSPKRTLAMASPPAWPG